MEKSSFEYTWYMPTKIVSERDCVKNNALLLSPLGKRALIVTGKSSATNGSLADMCAALRENGQEFEVFDEVTPNPVVSCIQKGAAKAREMYADFIVGIGGGSPMDAAKAIAALARQPRTDEEIFSGGWSRIFFPSSRCRLRRARAAKSLRMRSSRTISRERKRACLLPKCFRNSPSSTGNTCFPCPGIQRFIRR